MTVRNQTDLPPRRKILLAERDETLQGVLLSILELEGYQVMVAVDYHALASSAGPQQADLLLIHYCSTEPDESIQSGLAAIRQIRRQHPTWPIIAFSACGLRSAEAKLQAAGATHYLRMPFGPDGLLSVLRTI